MDAIRLATEDEVKKLLERPEDSIEFVPGSTVWAMGDNFAVIRQAVELDPVLFAPETLPSRKLAFIWGLENMLRFGNVPVYYFNIHEEDVAWREVVEKHGAERSSRKPIHRYRKFL
jgi:hypothetical protein